MDNGIYKSFKLNVNQSLIERLKNVRKKAEDAAKADASRTDPKAGRVDRDSARGEDTTLLDTGATVGPSDPLDDPETETRRKGNPRP